MARMVATKAALSIRVDALTDADGKSEQQASLIGLENRGKLESRLRALEYQSDMSGAQRFANNGKSQERFSMKGNTQTYNTATDAVDLVPSQREPLEVAMKAVLDVKDEKRKAKEEKKAKRRAEKEREADGDAVGKIDVDEESKETKKEKKRKRRESEVNGEADGDKPSVRHWSLNSSASIYYSAGGRWRNRRGPQGQKKGTQSRKEGGRSCQCWCTPNHRR